MESRIKRSWKDMTHSKFEGKKISWISGRYGDAYIKWKDEDCDGELTFFRRRGQSVIVTYGICKKYGVVRKGKAIKRMSS